MASKVSKILRYFSDKDYRWISNAIRGAYKYKTDEDFLTEMYIHKMGYAPNLEKPVHLSEKVQWLKLHYRPRIMVQLVDKVLVKDYVARKIGGKYIIPTLGVWDNVEDIDIATLPDQFVMKCNHNSGKGLCVCKDKKEINWRKVKKGLRKALKQDYYQSYREWPYKYVDRKVLAEKFIYNKDGSPLIDYKFYCFGGKPVYFMVSLGEAEHNVKNHKFDMNCQSIDHLFKETKAIDERSIAIPSNFEEMVGIVEKLCADFPHVRVDLYNVNGEIYFGEMTFFTNGGFISILSNEYADQVAALIPLVEVEYINE